MTGKKAITVALICFVVASFGYVIITESARKTTTEQPTDPASPVGLALAEDAIESGTTEARTHRIIAYYFHGNFRCPTCLSIEAYSQEALKEAFPDEIAAGTLEWQAVNTDEVWNTHFIQEFNLQFGSLVIADASGEKTRQWKNLVKVWELVRDKDAFFEYVQAETKPFLEGS